MKMDKMEKLLVALQVWEAVKADVVPVIATVIVLVAFPLILLLMC